MRHVRRAGSCRRLLWHLAFAGLALVVGGCAWAAGADIEATALERRVKAAFLYKFADFVEWPDAAFGRPDSPLVIGVAGDEQVAAELGTLTAGRTVGGRSIAVRRVKEADTLAGVHILFIGRAEASRLSQWIRAVQGRPVLIVTETEGALAQGSMINFVLSEGRVRFEIALASADRSGLVLSSRLLAVAHYVRPRTP